jgi:4-hydroxybenzoate polyprenyltransferase
MSLLPTLARFTKVEHTIFSLPLIFAGAYLGAGRKIPALATLAWLVLAVTGGRILGMAMNRILDRELDARNVRTRHREIPAGALSLRQGWLVAAAGLVVYLAACAMLGWRILALSPVPAILLISYSLLKRFTCLCHYGIGLVLGLAPLAAHVAVRGDLLVTREIVLLAGFVCCWMSGYDIIYALQDEASDRATGVHSLPSRLGGHAAQWVAGVTHLIGVLLLVALAAWCTTAPWVWVPVGVSALAMGISHLPWLPLPARFFPISAMAGIAGSLVVYA